MLNLDPKPREQLTDIEIVRSIVAGEMKEGKMVVSAIEVK